MQHRFRWSRTVGRSCAWWVLLILMQTGMLSAQQPGLGTVAYLRQGDLWIAPVPQGTARRLTTQGQARRPRWSPSGQWIAVLNAGTVTLLPAAGGRPRALAYGKNAPVYSGIDSYAWSPIEDILAYQTADGGLRVVTPGSWQDREIIEGFSGAQGLGVASFLWSPDGQTLAYTYIARRRDGRVVSPTQRTARLWRVNLRGGGGKILLDAGQPATFLPILAGWTPSGAHILYWRDSEFSASLLADGVPLYAMPARGGSSREVLSVMLADRAFISLAPPGRLLPPLLGSGREQRAVMTAGAGRASWATKQVVAVNLPTNTVAVLTGKSTAAIMPSLSPDGRQIVYSAMPDQGTGGNQQVEAGVRQRRIWIVQFDGSGLRQLTDDAAYRDEFPRWSTDGSRVLFLRIDRQSRASVWLMRPDGTAMTKVADRLGSATQRRHDPQWLGFYGTVAWGDYVDWWRGVPRTPSTRDNLVRYLGCAG